ncbi:hypothetical protein DP117_18920 [Brasilonema sp. UFV-L1]|nr:hypothetical protein [Brasilonema sp. UFV-L1]
MSDGNFFHQLELVKNGSGCLELFAVTVLSQLHQECQHRKTLIPADDTLLVVRRGVKGRMNIVMVSKLAGQFVTMGKYDRRGEETKRKVMEKLDIAYTKHHE